VSRRQHRDYLARAVADAELRAIAENLLESAFEDLARAGQVVGHAALLRAGRAPERARAAGCEDARAIRQWIAQRPALAARLVTITPSAIHMAGQQPTRGIALRVETVDGPCTIAIAHVVGRDLGELQACEWTERWIATPSARELS
jgi:hypothetical protein